MASITAIREQLSELGMAMLVAGMALLIAMAVLLLSEERDLRRSNAAVQRTNAALLQLADIKALVIGVDYSARGYALSGDELFARHEVEKQQSIKLGIGELTRLVRYEYASDIARMARILDRHADVYAQFVKLGPKRVAEMEVLITDPDVRQKRYDAIGAIDALHAELMGDLVAYQSQTEKRQRDTTILTFVILATAFLGGIVEVVLKFILRRR